MHVTQKEIADRLGVSRQLVTHALNGVGTISEQKRREVLDAAEQMGYRRNELARAVMTGKSRTLGIITDISMTEGLGRTIGGALEEAAKHGYATKLMYLPNHIAEAEAQEVLQQCTSWRLDGVLVAGLSDNHLEILKREMGYSNRPIAFTGNIPPEGSRGAYSDGAYGWRLAVKHLFELGHRRIAHLAADYDSKLARIRNDECLEVLHEFGLPVDEHTATFTSWHDSEMIEVGVARLLTLPLPPTALLCSGDTLAAVAFRVARRLGIEVPEQLSIVGYGGQHFTLYLDPPLTTIEQPHEEVARRAVQQLLAQLEDESGTNITDTSNQIVKVTSGFELLVRKSTARCP